VEDSTRPRASLARKVLPPPLWEALERVFSQSITGTALVGGTALAGFYAGHRRSDDLDLFSADENAFLAAVLAVRELEQAGVNFLNSSRSGQYFHANCLYRTHSFTIDVVLDRNLFAVGRFAQAGKVVVAELETLFRMKIAALVSRASEKDLFDLEWLFKKFPALKVKDWISLGQTLDKAVTGENLLASVAGTRIRKEACGFSLDRAENLEMVHQKLKRFQKSLVLEVATYLKALPTPPLGKLVRKIQ
jgi:predicted nucleotidyltransferase component of viral defense system